MSGMDCGFSISVEDDGYVIQTDQIRLCVPDAQIDAVVLSKADLSLSLALDGRVVIDPFGVSEDVIDAVTRANGLPSPTLKELVAKALDPSLVRSEDDPHQAVADLRAELLVCLAMVDAAAKQFEA